MKQIIEFFDRLSETWDNDTEVNCIRINHIIDVADIKPHAEVMDAGTGTGILIPFISERLDGGHIYAVDISTGMLAKAEAKFGDRSDVTFSIFNIEEDNSDKLFDNILLYSMYPHLRRPINTIEWLYKMNLKPGGTITIAHSQSKEEINGLHNHNGPVHSNHLVEAEVLRRAYMKRGLNVDLTEDNDTCYIIRLRKPSDK